MSRGPSKKAQVKGREHGVTIYELLGIRASDDPELAAGGGLEELCEKTRLASSQFEQGNFDEARRRHEEILQAFPGDPLAGSLLVMRSTVAVA